MSRSRSRSRSYSSYSSRSRSYSRSPSYSRSRSRSRSSYPARRKRSMSPLPTKILVEKLTKNATVAHLNEIFGAYGHINGIDMPTNKKWSVNRGVAYIEYETRSEAEKAISYMDGGQLDGAVLSCAFVPRRPSPPPPSIRRRGRGRADVTYLLDGSLEAVIEHEAGRRCDDILDLDLDRLYTEDVRILIVRTVPEVDLEHHILEVVVGVIQQAGNKGFL
ncbi:1906_t:CDS:2 [Paraglomus brasilianum]|uniref:1906_t:CDS:1 n=1 Tax=Paraglomus brasilianum TaxID=144538 RepID=A0A9N9EZN5_9GLOM|nr:1906_t:CDS:2 [Paraglomus brasilianum]